MKERILVVEDDSDITQILQIYLSNQGYEVQCAANGEQALQQMEDLPAELLRLTVTFQAGDVIVDTVGMFGGDDLEGLVKLIAGV